MDATDVLDVLDLLHDHGISAWVDGGWGVDVLVGRQTRPHKDLDLVVPAERADDIKRLMQTAGFSVVADDLPTRFTMSDEASHAVDFHPVTFDDHGNGVQQLRDGTTFTFPAAGFAGRGLISGQPVPCLTAGIQVLCHIGYEPDADDWHDMTLLRRHCGVDLPEPYRSGGGQL